MHSDTFVPMPVFSPSAGSFVGKDGALITLKQGQETLEQMKGWPHWEYIGAVAKKEYHLTEERFQQFLPEYQRFLCLIVLGVKGLGMFQADIDALWHSHILATLCYQQFCEAFNESEMIHHLPQVTAKPNNICSVCKSCTGCSTPHDCDNTLYPTEVSGDPQYFAQAYLQAFGEPPSPLWHLERFHEATSSVSLR